MRWIKTAILTLIVVSLIPSTVLADTSQDVVVTVTGFVVGVPGNFTIWYISDFEVDLSWEKPEGAENTEVRVKFGSIPEDRSDGYLVYYGENSTATDPNVDLTGAQMPYYRAWSQAAGGVWENVGSTEEADFMSQSFMFIGLIIMAGFLTFLARYTGQLLTRMAAALIWLVLGVWLLIGNIENLGMESPWTQVLAFVFVIMVFVPLTWQMSTEVRNEAGGRSRNEWGRVPEKETIARSAAVKARHREKLRGPVGVRRPR